MGSAPYWAVDVLSRDALNAATTHWPTVTFLSLLPARLVGLVYLAYLVLLRYLVALGAAATLAAGPWVVCFAEEGAPNCWLV